MCASFTKLQGGNKERENNLGKCYSVIFKCLGKKMIIWSNLMFEVKNNNIHLSCGSLVMARLKRYLNKIIFHGKKIAM